MTIEEARRVIWEFDDLDSKPTKEEFADFVHASEFLIDKCNNPKDMMHLGGVYYEMRQFDLALKYYEMAEAMDYEEALECLGYIWYYGRTGERDFKKAYEYFSRAMNRGNLVATYKVADMYKNGYYVEKDYDKYREMIEKLYLKVRKCKYIYDPVPEVYTRLARIRTEEGAVDEAVVLYSIARDYLAQRIRRNAFFGNLNIMKWLINDLYELIDLEERFMNIYDLYYLCKAPHKVVFMFEDKELTLESVQEGDQCCIRFQDKCFDSIDDFFNDGEVCGERITSVGEDFYDFRIVA